MKHDVSRKALELYTASKTKCTHCGHTMNLGRAEKLICTGCGYFIYKNKKVEFINELKKSINKLKRYNLQ